MIYLKVKKKFKKEIITCEIRGKIINVIWGKKGQNMYKGTRKESAFNIK